MASPDRRLPTNVDGPFFVDSTCIDCDTCRWMAPATFDRAEGRSRVARQPGTGAERDLAFRALIACPTGSIGGPKEPGLARARSAFPVALGGDVHHCGWHAEASFGAASYLIRRPRERGGNVLEDSPRFARPLAEAIAAMGGVATMFLTHCDDVADHAKWAERFGCERVLHRRDLTGGTRDVERLVEGEEPVALDPELLAIPVPGHTEGSTCLLWRGTLFSGDHLMWSPTLGHLVAPRRACWYSWPESVRSLERLRGHEFTRVLPGHGWRFEADAGAMRAELERAVEWARTA